MFSGQCSMGFWSEHSASAHRTGCVGMWSGFRRARSGFRRARSGCRRALLQGVGWRASARRPRGTRADVGTAAAEVGRWDSVRGIRFGPQRLIRRRCPTCFAALPDALRRAEAARRRARRRRRRRRRSRQLRRAAAKGRRRKRSSGCSRGRLRRACGCLVGTL